MSTVVRAAAPPAARPAPAGKAPARRAGSAPVPARGVRRLVAGTPGKLRIAAAVSVLAGLVFGLLGFASFQSRTSALREGTEHAEQVVRLQQIGTELVTANSIATGAYLAGGESAAERADFEQSITGAERLIGEAVAAQPGDAARLATVSTSVGVYRQQVQGARDNTVQGNSLAVGYLRQAQANLTAAPSELVAPAGLTPIMDALNGLEGRNARQADTAFGDASASWRLLSAALVTFAGLVVVQVWLARRTRRVLNLPLLAATLVVLVVGAAGIVVAALAGQQTGTVRDGTFAAATDVGTARSELFAGKSAENLAVIYVAAGGDVSGAAKSFDDASSAAGTALAHAGTSLPGTPDLAAELANWKAAHDGLMNTAQEPDGGPPGTGSTAAAAQVSDDRSDVNQAFATLDSRTAGEQTSLTKQAFTGLRDPLTSQDVAGWALLVGGLVAAGLAATGVAQRLREYR